MTHDPLCPRFTYDMPCCCNLIERVRFQERQMRQATIKAPTVACPECFEHVELRIDFVQHVDEEGDLSIQVNVDPQPVWDHAAKHVWDGGAMP